MVPWRTGQGDPVSPAICAFPLDESIFNEALHVVNARANADPVRLPAMVMHPIRLGDSDLKGVRGRLSQIQSTLLHVSRVALNATEWHGLREDVRVHAQSLEEAWSQLKAWFGQWDIFPPFLTESRGLKRSLRYPAMGRDDPVTMELGRQQDYFSRRLEYTRLPASASSLRDS